MSRAAAFAKLNVNENSLKAGSIFFFLDPLEELQIF